VNRIKKVKLITHRFEGEQMRDGRNWKLTAPIVFMVNDVIHTIPAGFKTDLTTLIGEGKHTICAVIHDYLYWIGIYSRRESDIILLKCCKLRGTWKCRRGWIYAGLRLGGWAAWCNHRKQKHCLKNVLGGNNETI